ncbi:MAG: holo-[acyl-carrier-protein] synthase [Planctomycetota bacterium]|nr:MAG: holo-[acyl-carrier-protein] synthase [Planctomycetota bacterium]
MALPTSLHEVPGIGIDLVEISRFGEVLDRQGEALLRKVFTAAERRECEGRAQPKQHFAARFAAKEAAMKALGTGWADGISFHDFEVHSDGKGPPRLQLAGKALELVEKLGLGEAKLSLTHTGESAAAVVMIRVPDAAP